MDASLIATIRADLAPRLSELINRVNDEHQYDQSSFFTTLLVNLNTTTNEEELLAVFMDLSTTAFHGFNFQPTVARDIDDMLAAAEHYAALLAADYGPAH